MNELLDENIAARIRAECRDANDLQRFQRAVYIVETILEAYGLPKTVKAVRKLRIGLGRIPEDPPEPKVEKPREAQPLEIPQPAPQPSQADLDTFTGAADPLTGKRRRKAKEPAA